LLAERNRVTLNERRNPRRRAVSRRQDRVWSLGNIDFGLVKILAEIEYSRQMTCSMRVLPEIGKKLPVFTIVSHHRLVIMRCW
jgi:hypothetical protein